MDVDSGQRPFFIVKLKRNDFWGPERPAFCAEFEKLIHDWNYRTLVKPGLSGLAQVKGGYGLLLKEKVALDLWRSTCLQTPPRATPCS